MSAFVLKLLASILMVLDNMHNLTLLLLYHVASLPPAVAGHLSYIIEAFGRIPMPIFAFFIAEGMRKTGNRKRYLARLLIFALASEIPFDFALNHFYQPSTRIALANAGQSFLAAHYTSQNVGFTLLLGAAGIFVFDWSRSNGAWHPFRFVMLVWPLVLAELGRTNFGICGVLLIYAAYFLNDRKKMKLLAMGGILTVLYMGYTTFWFKNGLNMLYTYVNWLMSLASLGLLALYNGEKGKRNTRFFYFVYPVGLAITAILINLLA